MPLLRFGFWTVIAYVPMRVFLIWNGLLTTPCAVSRTLSSFLALLTDRGALGTRRAAAKEAAARPANTTRLDVDTDI